MSKQVTQEWLDNFKESREAIIKEATRDQILFKANVDSIDSVIEELSLDLEPRLKVMFKWYDLWVGAFVDDKKRYVYINLLPMIVIRIRY